MKTVRLFIILSIVLVPGPALGSELRTGVESNFVIDNNNINETANSLQTYVDGNIQLGLGYHSNIFLSTGYLYTQRKAAVSSTSTGNLTSGHPYVGITLAFCSDKLVCALSGYYSPYVRAQYSETGSSAETWLGSSYQAKVSLRPRLSESFALMISINYFSASYTVKGDAASVSTVERFQTSTIFPTVGFQYLWSTGER